MLFLEKVLLLEGWISCRINSISLTLSLSLYTCHKDGAGISSAVTGPVPGQDRQVVCCSTAQRAQLTGSAVGETGSVSLGEDAVADGPGAGGPRHIGHVGVTVEHGGHVGWVTGG